MEKEIKKLIKNILKMIKKDHITILECLEKLNISVVNFLIALGVNKSLLENSFGDEIIEEISNLLKSPETIISYDENMTDLEYDQIELYNPLLKREINILKNKITILNDKKFEENGLCNDTCAYKGYTWDSIGLRRIMFNYSIFYDKEVSKKKFMMQGFVLQDMEIRVQSEIIEVGKSQDSKNFYVNMKDGITMSDFNTLINHLYHNQTNYVYAFLLSCNAKEKIVEDDFILKNMNKEANR